MSTVDGINYLGYTFVRKVQVLGKVVLCMPPAPHPPIQSWRERPQDENPADGALQLWIGGQGGTAFPRTPVPAKCSLIDSVNRMSAQKMKETPRVSAARQTPQI